MKIERKYWVVSASALVLALGLALVAVKLGFQGYDSQLELYVSPSGSDTNTGTIDSPFATITKARDTLRTAKAGITSPGPLTVWLRGGIYTLDNTFSLTSADAGTSSNPIVYRSYPGERASIGAGLPLTGFTDVTDPTIANRLSTSARANVKKVDLAALGLTNFGSIQKWGGGGGNYNEAQGVISELYFNSERMTIARWPNKPDEALTAGVNDRTITYPDNRLDTWAEPTKAWAHGYFKMDWYDQYNKIESVDTQNNTVTFETTNLGYGYGNGSPYYFLNVLEELDSAGEYYIDTTNSQLYFWPPSTLNTSPILTRSTLDGNGVEQVIDLIKPYKTSHIYFMSLDLAYSRGRAAYVNASDDIRFIDCDFKHIGERALLLSSSKNLLVTSSRFDDIGFGGITVWDSNEAFSTLVSSNNKIINNNLTGLGKWITTYSGGLDTHSVGLRFARNYVHDLEHLAVSFGGNDNLIENNEIRRVVNHANDGGAIYAGRQIIERGTIVRGNLISDVHGYDNNGAAGIYLDDGQQGITVENNIIDRVTQGVALGGGREVKIRNNIILNYGWTKHTSNTLGISFDDRGIGWMAYRYPMKIISATNTTPIVIKTEHWNNFNWNPGRSWKLIISGVEGNTAANGIWDITILSNDTFSLNNAGQPSVGNGEFTAAGEPQAVVQGETAFLDSVNNANSAYRTKYPELFGLGKYELALPVSTIENNIVWDSSLPDSWLKQYMWSIGPDETLKTHPGTVQNNFHTADPKVAVDYTLAADSPARGTGFVPFTPDYGRYTDEEALKVLYPVDNPKPGTTATYQLQSSANVAEAGEETFEVYNLPAGAVYDSISKQITWTPTSDQVEKSFSAGVITGFSEPIFGTATITLTAGKNDTVSPNDNDPGDTNPDGSTDNNTGTTSGSNTSSGSTRSNTGTSSKKSTGSATTSGTTGTPAQSTGETATTATPTSTTDMTFDNQDTKDKETTSVVKTLGANKSIAIGATVLFALIVIGVAVFLIRRKTDLNAD